MLEETSAEPAIQQATPQRQAAEQPEKRPTFPNLQKGFIQHMHNEGYDDLERKGNDNLRPDAAEMKILSYMKKVIWFLQQAHKAASDQLSDIFKRYSQQHRSIAPFYEVSIAFSIGAKGELEDIRIVNSCGIPAVDNYVRGTFYSAAPFPGLPKHLGTSFKYGLTISVYTPGASSKPRFSFNI